MQLCFWQVIAVIVALIVCGWSIVEKQWLGAIAGIVLVSFEVRSIRLHTLGHQGQ